MGDLSALIERVEKATGPHFALDNAIAHFVWGEASPWHTPPEYRQSISPADGPPLQRERRKPVPKQPEQLREIRARAWATRRAKYGAQLVEYSSVLARESYRSGTINTAIEDADAALLKASPGGTKDAG